MDQNQRRAVMVKDKSIKIYYRRRITQAHKEKSRFYLSSSETSSAGNYVYDA